jgi:hypothetical protein
MPVFDTQIQNGDRAFLYMVIEIILVSRFRKFGPYYKNIGYYRVTEFRFKIIGAERLTRTRSISSSSTTSPIGSQTAFGKVNGGCHSPVGRSDGDRDADHGSSDCHFEN